MYIVDRIIDFFGLKENEKIKLLMPCLIISGLILSVFIPWSIIFRCNVVVETIVGLLCMFLVGLLILLVFEWLLVIACLASLVLYALFIIKNWQVKCARIFFVIFICIILFALINFKEVQELYQAAFTGSWWGGSEYFGRGF